MRESRQKCRRREFWRPSQSVCTGTSVLGDAHRVFERPEGAFERQRHPYPLDSRKVPQAAISEIWRHITVAHRPPERRPRARLSTWRARVEWMPTQSLVDSRSVAAMPDMIDVFGGNGIYRDQIPDTMSGTMSRDENSCRSARFTGISDFSI